LVVGQEPEVLFDLLDSRDRYNKKIIPYKFKFVVWQDPDVLFDLLESRDRYSRKIIVILNKKVNHCFYSIFHIGRPQ
jgi:hypothetical protein